MQFGVMASSDFYASGFGIAYSTYMERPRLSRLVAEAVWGADVRPYYESMAAVAEVEPGGTIVDCPCGAGPALRALHPDQDVRYVAVDLSPSMLRRARKRIEQRNLRGVELLHADATRIPLPAKNADLFLSYWGLHCFPEPAAALAEAARIVRPGGRLVGAALVKGDESLRQRVLIRDWRGDFGRVGTAVEVSAWIEEAGFVGATLRRSGPMLFFAAQRG
jgi:SAM-dependent methyltransferase